MDSLQKDVMRKATEICEKDGQATLHMQMVDGQIMYSFKNLYAKDQDKVKGEFADVITSITPLGPPLMELMRSGKVTNE